MDTDKIIQDLNRRFAAPLPEFYQRRIIFWYGEDKEFSEINSLAVWLSPYKIAKKTSLQVNLQGVFFHHFAWLVAFTNFSQNN